MDEKLIKKDGYKYAPIGVPNAMWVEKVFCKLGALEEILAKHNVPDIMALDEILTDYPHLRSYYERTNDNN